MLSCSRSHFLLPLAVTLFISLSAALPQLIAPFMIPHQENDTVAHCIHDPISLGWQSPSPNAQKISRESCLSAISSLRQKEAAHLDEYTMFVSYNSPSEPQAGEPRVVAPRFYGDGDCRLVVALLADLEWAKSGIPEFPQEWNPKDESFATWNDIAHAADKVVEGCARDENGIEPGWRPWVYEASLIVLLMPPDSPFYKEIWQRGPRPDGRQLAGTQVE